MNNDRRILRGLRELIFFGIGISVMIIGRAEDSPRAPATIYAQVCGYCHGANVGPVILGRKLSVPTTKLLVRTGPHAMPAFRPTEISDSELDALARWIEASAPNPSEHGK